jgi:prepilin-type N-terminal cleavage/methylation domain-containing protein
MRRGFTLIELLVVISIIAILVAAATASWRNAQMKGRDGKRKTDLKAVQQALENYLQTYGRYPTSSGGVITCSGGSAGNGNNNWGSIFQCPATSGSIFMQQLPQDPVYQSTTGYYYNSTGDFSYVISSLLENTNDPDIPPKGTLPCTPQTGRNYCVINP